MSIERWPPRRLVELATTACMTGVITACGGSAVSTRTPATIPATASATVRPTATRTPEPLIGHNISLSFVSATHGWLGRGITQDDGQILVTKDGGATWAQQYRGKVWPEVMQFVDDKHGWMTGCILSTGMSGHCERPFLATSDGGATWSPVAGYRGGEIFGVSFMTPLDGWVLADPCGGSAQLCETLPAQLFATSDGGATWSQLHLPDSVGPLSIMRFDDKQAWVMTEGDVFATSDGGATWRRASTPCHLPQADWAGAPLPGTSASFVDAERGWIGCSGNGGGTTTGKTLYKSVDGGRSWNLIAETRSSLGQANTPPSGVGELDASGTLSYLLFLDASQGWLALNGPSTNLYRTADGGRTWSPVNVGVDGISHLFATDATHLWAWSGASLLRSIDGGAHWQRMETTP